MTCNEAKKLQNGAKIVVEKTGKTKTVLLTTECVGKYGERYVDILCDDNTAYYNFEVK